MIPCVVTRIVNKNKGSVWETQAWINIRNVTLGASFRYSELALVKMSRTVAFGRDILNAPDVDIEDLLACLSSTEVQEMLDELASDPDDKHVPPSVR